MKLMKKYVRNQQSGMVSLFIVIFSALLISVLVIGFIRLMIQDQQQATNNDLSQSAYDSAMSGVSDAKRVIRACELGSVAACTALNDQKCETVVKSDIVGARTDKETTIKSLGPLGSGDTTLNQAYTCVIVTMNTPDYLVNLKEGQSQVVPLKATAPFNTIVVQWMHRSDGSNGSAYLGGDPTNINQPTSGNNYSILPSKSVWNPSAPSLLRVMAATPATASNVSLSSLDTGVASTVFLRPANIMASGTSNINVSLGSPRAAASGSNATTNLWAVACSNAQYTGGDYACQATLKLKAGQVVPAGSTVAFMQLTSLYRDTSVKISLLQGAAAVTFDGVQPMVDSTGRANDVFRRVRSRLQVGSADFPLPEAAIDTTGSLCKDFYVTNTTSGPNGISCTTAP